MEPGITDAFVWRTVVAALVLAFFAYAYDRWIERLEARGRHDGYLSLIVAGGVMVVLTAALFVVWPLGLTARLSVLIAGGMFLPAGLPMIIGSARRHADRREAELRKLYESVHEDLR